ncbi:MAG: hypothetical protein M3Z17_08165 [Gemmatimonadota bacterium]|nr:hypothetical protein [Gemmatimonadota bacterium]
MTTTPATQQVLVPPPPPNPTPLKEIHWFRNSAEMRGIYLEVYHLAAEQLDRLASENAPGTWAVILDADETAIDNSTFEKELGTGTYTEAAWKGWVSRKAAPALPGVVEFTQLVHRLGGTVVIVTNRDNAYCDATRENIKSDKIDADLVLCRTTTGDKNPRFETVANGTASASLGPRKVLMWFGDNIQDFPKLTQSLRDGDDAGYSNFGKTWFLLPNPMYGSWEKVPYR